MDLRKPLTTPYTSIYGEKMKETFAQMHAAGLVEKLKKTQEQLDEAVSGLAAMYDEVLEWKDRALLAEAQLNQRTYIYEGDGKFRLQRCEKCGEATGNEPKPHETELRDFIEAWDG